MLKPLGIACVLAIALAGCREQSVPATRCMRVCFDHTIYKLSSIDHEQPDPIKVMDACERVSEPCCFTKGAGAHICHAAPPTPEE